MYTKRRGIFLRTGCLVYLDQARFQHGIQKVINRVKGVCQVRTKKREVLSHTRCAVYLYRAREKHKGIPFRLDTFPSCRGSAAWDIPYKSIVCEIPRLPRCPIVNHRRIIALNAKRPSERAAAVTFFPRYRRKFNQIRTACLQKLITHGN